MSQISTPSFLTPTLLSLLPMFLCFVFLEFCLSFLHPQSTHTLSLSPVHQDFLSLPISITHWRSLPFALLPALLDSSQMTLYYLFLQASEQKGRTVSHSIHNCFRCHPWCLILSKTLSQGPGWPMLGHGGQTQDPGPASERAGSGMPSCWDWQPKV